MLLSIKNIHKTFKTVKALRGVSLDLQRGEFVALLGPNGAGKTTLVEIIEGLQKPDSGDVHINGMTWKKNFKDIQKILGLSLQETFFFDRCTVFEVLRLFASFFKVRDEVVEKILTRIGMQDKRNAYSMTLSGGQRQRLALGIALLNDPELLILDEPTTGLDPKARREIWDILQELKDAGNTTLLLTTHYMEEAEVLCERIVLLDQGHILKDQSLESLLLESGHKDLNEIFLNMTGRRLSDDSVV